ncbi:serine/threonine protein phosphatase [Catellatospora sp. IY07-71]|uniref:metallophosphoesterase n=1 Tax=Catellatospora sp. IY07-71 TaxID=2728827 RepID=UPI001BB38AE4|nr:metallophosphoesterase [Catellatospora sp. IY07-71]BCJ77967.1 serine/threonine protein phosphatase [Catellatospora sp. IY07-71]
MTLYVVGDVHGHLAPLTGALREAGLLDEAGAWCGGAARLWFLGDLTDRGPDGIGVIDLIRRLQAEAAAAGGEVGCVIGNHDMLLYGSRFIPESPVTEVRTIIQVWALNGGQEHDLDRLDEERAGWLAGLPAIALVDDHLLLHADTMAYLEFGGDLTEINATLRRIMQERDAATFGRNTRLLFRRFEFLEHNDGVANARTLLERLGGRQIVHGHSTIPETFGVPPAAVQGPITYAEGLVMAVDTGISLGAPCLVIPLATPQPA